MKDPEYDLVGVWSEVKLEIIRDYAKEYSKIIASQPNRLRHIYIDAFAGPGVHLSRATGEFIPGSPLNALMIEPPFREFHRIPFHRRRREPHCTVEGACRRPEGSLHLRGRL